MRGRLVCITAFVVGFLTPAPPVHAAFPGRNGQVAWVTDPGRTVGLPPAKRTLRTLIPTLREADFPGEIQFSPSGRLIAFTLRGDENSNRNEIWIRRAARRARRRRLLPNQRTPFEEPLGCTGCYGDHDPEWSPDGQSIVFSRTELIGDQRLGEPTIYIYHRGSVRPLTKGSDPTWSTHGEIAFVRDVGTLFTGNALFTIRPDGSGERQIPNTRDASEPDWSPRGYRLAFVQTDVTRDNPDRHIATIFSTGEGKRRLTKSSTCSDESPTFSPGGGQLAFARQGDDCPGVSESLDPDDPGLIAAIRTDGRHFRRLARRDVWDNLDWQPRPR